MNFNGTGNAQTIGGTGSTNTFNDRSPLYGYSYYGLKQVDFDGQFEYFEAVIPLKDFREIALQRGLPDRLPAGQWDKEGDILPVMKDQSLY